MSAYKMQQIYRQEAMKAMNLRTSMEIGKVISYDPVNYLVIVELYPEDDETPALQTGWIPLLSPWIGDGWGLFCPPSIGDMIEVQFQSGSLNNGVATLRSFTTESPPLSVPSGEFWLVHKTGSFIKMLNTGAIEISTPSDITVNAVNAHVNASAVASVSAPTVQLGDLESNDALIGLMNSVARSVYNTHTHNYTSGVTGTPNEQIDTDAVTTHVTAN